MRRSTNKNKPQRLLRKSLAAVMSTALLLGSLPALPAAAAEPEAKESTVPDSSGQESGNPDKDVPESTDREDTGQEGNVSDSGEQAGVSQDSAAPPAEIEETDSGSLYALKAGYDAEEAARIQEWLRKPSKDPSISNLASLGWTSIDNPGTWKGITWGGYHPSILPRLI